MPFQVNIAAFARHATTAFAVHYSILRFITLLLVTLFSLNDHFLRHIVFLSALFVHTAILLSVDCLPVGRDVSPLHMPLPACRLAGGAGVTPACH